MNMPQGDRFCGSEPGTLAMALSDVIAARMNANDNVIMLHLFCRMQVTSSRVRHSDGNMSGRRHHYTHFRRMVFEGV
jgi:hypothetical protein